jgi:hypothetical protein
LSFAFSSRLDAAVRLVPAVADGTSLPVVPAVPVAAPAPPLVCSEPINLARMPSMADTSVAQFDFAVAFPLVPVAISRSSLFRCVRSCANWARSRAGIELSGISLSACFAARTWSAGLVAVSGVCDGDVVLCDVGVCVVGCGWGLAGGCANPDAGRAIRAAAASAVDQ